MRWVTRKRIRVNRAAPAWLVRRFIDPDATFEFTEPEQVANIQRASGAIAFGPETAEKGSERDRSSN